MINSEKNQKGVTLIALVVAVTVLIILASVATYSGIDTLRSAKLTAFTSELKIMQAKVNEYYDTYKNETTDKIVADGMGKKLDLTNSEVNKAFQGAEITTNKEQYVLVDSTCQKKMGIEGLKYNFLVNFKTRNVIALEGYSYKGKTYYTLDEGPGQVPKGVYNVEYNEKTGTPTFNIEKKENTDGTLNVKIIPDPFPGIEKWYVEYIDTTDEKNIKRITEDMTIKLDKNKTYQISIFNGNIRSNIVTIEGIKEASINESFVGQYADFENESGERIPDGKPDGIIFADLAAEGNGVEKQWYDSDGVYTIPKVDSGLKQYYVSSEKVTDARWSETEAKKLISPINSSGQERFYVMALEDVDSNYHTWYNSAYNKMTDYNTYTSGDFGTGKENTKRMIARSKVADGSIPEGYPNSGTIPYGAIDSNDLWALNGVLNKVSKGWFVPSRAEWSAFANELKISEDSSNAGHYVKHKLEDSYWSSSQHTAYSAYFALFSSCYIYASGVSGNLYVRLASTF